MAILPKHLFHDETGPGLIEYALIVALVAVGLIVAITLLRTAAGDLRRDADRLNAASSLDSSGGYDTGR